MEKSTKFRAVGQAIFMEGIDFPPVLVDTAKPGKDRQELFDLLAHMMNYWVQLRFVARKSLELLTPKMAPDDPQLAYLKKLFEEARGKET